MRASKSFSLRGRCVESVEKYGKGHQKLESMQLISLRHLLIPDALWMKSTGGKLKVKIT
jgi:hypothetical protein